MVALPGALKFVTYIGGETGRIETSARPNALKRSLGRALSTLYEKGDRMKHL